MNKRLTHKEMLKVCESLKQLENPYQPYTDDSTWWRIGENERYAFESSSYNLDHRIIDKKTNKEVWSYYSDFYNGEI